MKRIKAGIIGGTNGMGKWFAGLLRKEGCSVHVCGRKTRLQINDLVRLCDVIVVAVPISATVDIIKQVGPLLSEDKLLMDLTSLKKEPVKLMLDSSAAEVIGCHPLFGPQLQDVTGQNVIVCPARSKKWLIWLKSVFKKNKMAVWEATPEKHDKMMAVIQALNHFNTITLGMALAQTNITPAEINKFSTPIFRTKLDIIRKVFLESPELYLDIITKNPQTGKMLDIYEKSLKEIREKIKSSRKAESKKAIKKAAKKLYGSQNK
ncbi:prephenate and/or arogenate dehydrogenase (unknown specificity) [hydrocarbon metagenome]|uniref:Prephenate/arogenate dehydrogenase domain-containing protein n=1 Tax=hydrocarbon metagenome TaxID=938273 RepID=A0A0W8FT57_9ZZZZ